MSIWDAMEMLNTLIDESDPDTSVGQIEHLLQTAEAIGRDGKPDWMQLTGLIHDLGKLLCFFGAEGQWDVVGDTFVVGCQFSEKIIYHDTFTMNPDWHNEKLMTTMGIYEQGCGLDNVMLSWGHDEYLYNICKKQSRCEYRRCCFIALMILCKLTDASECSTKRGTFNDTISFVLPMASRRSLYASHKRRRCSSTESSSRIQP